MLEKLMLVLISIAGCKEKIVVLRSTSFVLIEFLHFNRFKEE
jgi:hypothetical protein